MLALLLVAASGDAFDDVARPFLDAHCVRCHGGTEVRSGLDLAGTTAASVEEDTDAWQWLLERVEADEMPPPGEARPGDDERAAFLAWLTEALDAADGDASKDAEPPLAGVPLRRLTRIEYESAARTLLGVEIDASRFLPEDVVGHGFDHVAAAQTLSENDFVRYLEAAEAVAERAVPDAEAGPPRTRRYGPGDMAGGRASRGARWLYTNGTAGPIAPLSRAGEYLVRVRAYGEQAGPDPCRVRLVLGDDSRSEVFEVDAGPGDEPVVLEARLSIERAGDHLVGARFLNDYYVPPRDGREREDRNLAVRSVEVVGPLDAARPTAFWSVIERRLEAADDREATLRSVAGDLASMIWRAPAPADEDVDALLALSSPNDGPDRRVRAALTGILASPRFVFKEELGRAGAPDARGSVALSPHEIATRLAGFLWSSVPDRQLLERADGGDLDGVEGVRRVAEDMLADRRADALAVGFGEQWLQLRVLDAKRADDDAFPNFSRRLVASMREETRRVLIDSLRERRSVWELIEGEQTFVDDRLMRLYGLGSDDVVAEVGEGWRRVRLDGTERRGLLGHAGVLFATSEATRTSPVRRGKWVLDVLLGSAPPPPPPGADNLAESAEGDEDLSLRERFERHRADPSCASCHARMDPLGFGLEAFDAIGAERPPEDAARRDVSGVLPDGRSFDGPVELAAVLRGEDRFVDAFIERLFVYALGRGLERADRRSLAAIRGTLDEDGPTMHSAILGIVTSPEFLRMPREERNDGEK
ncbi:MAG: DUF1592 domain-containing protein [Planctomycetota bacterium]